MDSWAQKALWVVLPSLTGVGVTVFAGPRLDLELIAWGVLALIALGGVWATNAKAHREAVEEADREWKAAIDARFDLSEEADRAQLRNALVQMHREWAEDKGYITLEALEYATKTYEIYHKLGGNGSGTKLYRDINELPIREERR